jgi:hypothetical protein
MAMNHKLRAAFRALTFILLGVTIWTAYANVYSDDGAVRQQAEAVLHKEVCATHTCKVTGMHGDRGMIDESITYELAGRGPVIVQCRRVFVALGDYGCVVRK